MISQKEIDEYDKYCEEKKKLIPGGGIWDTEPNRIEFKSSGFDCLMVRNDMLCWCGYVGVKPSHPAHGKHYDKVDVEVHGGLTYGNRCNGKICHISEAPDDTYWLGFDTAHSMDEMPVMRHYRMLPGWPSSTFKEIYPDTYRDVNYVKAEVEKLARQFKEMESVSQENTQ